MHLLVYEVLACIVAVVLAWLGWRWLGGNWRAAVFVVVSSGGALALSLEGEMRGRVVSWWARVRLAWWAQRWPRLPQRQPLTPCRECGKVLPYPCTTLLCDDCLSQPTREDLQRELAHAVGMLQRAQHAARSWRTAMERTARANHWWQDRHYRAVLELRRRRKQHADLMGYVGLLRQAQRKAKRNLDAADAAVLRRFDEVRALNRELEHERRERTRQQERADEAQRRLERAERDHEATAEALHTALRERDALDEDRTRLTEERDALGTERTRLAVELEALGEHFERAAEEMTRPPEDTK
jgi:hypothetical protein